MSLIAFLGAVEIGLVFGLVALGVFLSFRVLQFPDLTVDGSFPLGAAVAATLIVSGWNPWLATALAEAPAQLCPATKLPTVSWTPQWGKEPRGQRCVRNPRVSGRASPVARSRWKSRSSRT